MKLQDLYNNVIAQFEGQFGQAVPVSPKAFLRVLAKVISGSLLTIHKYVAFTAAQQFVTTATMSPTTIYGRTVSPLVEWGRTVGAGDPKAATSAQLSLTATGAGTVTTGTQLINKTTQQVYLVTQDATLPGAILVQAATPGTAANMATGAVLEFANPQAGIASIATVTAVLVTASGAEDEATYRARVLAWFQRRPTGGSLSDYWRWCTSVSGVTDVYPYRGSPGMVELYIRADDVPTEAQIQAVRDALLPVIPVGAVPLVLPVTQTTISVRVTALEPIEARADVEEALRAYFKSREPWIAGLSVLPRYDRITTSAVAGVVNQVIVQYGGAFGSVQLSKGGVAFGDYPLARGEITTLGAVTW